MKRFALKVVLLAGVVGLGVFSGLGPWRLAASERSDAAREVEKARAAERMREEMIRKEAELRSPLGREATARKRGYLKPGEMPAAPVVPPPPSPVPE